MKHGSKIKFTGEADEIPVSSRSNNKYNTIEQNNNN